MAERQSGVVGYDLTISVEKSTVHDQQVAQQLGKVLKKWVFQRERSESGYDHWQVRERVRPT